MAGRCGAGGCIVSAYKYVTSISTLLRKRWQSRARGAPCSTSSLFINRSHVCVCTHIATTNVRRRQILKHFCTEGQPTSTDCTSQFCQCNQVMDRAMYSDSRHQQTNSVLDHIILQALGYRTRCRTIAQFWHRSSRLWKDIHRESKKRETLYSCPYLC